eukprot:TRINITY_DN3131_c0_g1_i3.p1 TRINITY_DN3131_c0_g1~~TRINITY_DN3131_c0_g1_i3.p1  ORF type:complete len:188 (-),score=28.95 TRINITY_DN3131_c0_g1_i3:146-709(-)
MQEELKKVHPLKTEWSFWFLKRQQGNRDSEGYEKGIKHICSFGTAEDFWACYNHLLRPEDIPYCDLQLFRKGVKPLWEDEENKCGGKWIVTVPRGKKLSSRFWENTLLAVIGNQFGVPEEEICGVVISTRYHKDILSVWTKHAEDEELKNKIGSVLTKILGPTFNLEMSYRSHNQTSLESKTKPWEK